MSRIGGRAKAAGIDLEAFRARVQLRGAFENNFPTPIEMRDIRHRLNLTADDVAKSMGCERWTLLKWEEGKGRPSWHLGAKYMVLYDEMKRMLGE